MTSKKLMSFRLTQPFSLKDRMKILFGHLFVQDVQLEITAKAGKKEVTIEHGEIQRQAFLGRPSKKALP